MGMFLAADDMNVGDWVTLHSRVTQSRRSRRQLLKESLEPWPARRGVPVKIAAVNLPFLMCESCERGKSARRPLVIEVDKFRLCRVTKEYATEFSRLKELLPASDEAQDDADQ